MDLNLKNPRAHTLATELSALTGQSLTTAVIEALEHQLEVERRKVRRNTTAERILAFADKFAPGMATGSASQDHAALLYDENGMPQ